MARVAKRKFKRGDVIYRTRCPECSSFAWRPVTIREHSPYSQGVIIIAVGQARISDWAKYYDLWPAPQKEGLKYRVCWGGINYEERSKATRRDRISRDVLRRFKKASPQGKFVLDPKSTPTLLSGTFGGKDFFILGV